MEDNKMGELGWQEYLLFFSIFSIIFFLIALINILKSNFKQSSDKAIWLIVILLLPFLGSLLYFIIGRNQRNKNNF